MPKEKEIRHEKKKGLTDKELIEKYGELSDSGNIFPELINLLLSKPSPNAPVKTTKRR